MATNYYNINSDNYQDMTGNLRSLSHPKQMFSGARTFPSIDLLYGPYQSKEFAHKFLIRHFDYKNLYDIDTCISKNGGEIGKKIPQGQTVAIIEDGVCNEYWYKNEMPSTGYTVDDLVLKQSNSSDTSSDGGYVVDNILYTVKVNIYPTSKVADIISSNDSEELTLEVGNMIQFTETYLKNIQNNFSDYSVTYSDIKVEEESGTQLTVQDLTTSIYVIEEITEDVIKVSKY